MTSPSDWRARVPAAFATDGPLAQGASFHRRDAQLDMAQAVATAIAAQSALVVEAGTGVGKTFAYLVPLLLAGRKALVSTATKALQDQLFGRDLPRLRAALKVPITTALLKGRASYLCLYRLEQARTGAGGMLLPDRASARALARVETWAQATFTGDLAELDGLDERSPLIPLVTSTRENCLGSDCPAWGECHVMRARREALAADLVVINHHLFFADLALREGGVGELLPTAEVVVFDEAHQMVEAGVQFLGHHLGSHQLIDYGRDLLAAGLQHARGLAPWAELAAGVETAARQLRLTAAEGLPDVRASIKRNWDEVALGAELAGVGTALRAVSEALAPVLASAPDFARLDTRARELAALAARFAQPMPVDRVRWAELSTHQVRLAETPLDIRDMLSQQRAATPRTWVFTSATLGDDAALSWFAEAAGLEDATKLTLASPFDYPAHARVYVPTRLPPPQDPNHAAAVGRAAAHCAQALSGRTFVLTTTLRALAQVAEALAAELARLGCGVRVLVQGKAAKRTLLAEFERGDAVLVGSASFWEGIDMPGEALQCVFIDKLPFPPPHDPLVQARVRQLKAQGRDAFDAYFVAEAAIALKQGAGRLIRSETDQGLLVLGDTRLRSARYGARLLAALPPMAPLASGAEALTYLRSLR
ncbi:MAG: ATP-dependent DNA helicase [Proteobacteria bacterium]|nr:ATP-dependent DNA helicase [Pseudomonadota bacterium]